MSYAEEISIFSDGERQARVIGLPVLEDSGVRRLGLWGAADIAFASGFLRPDGDRDADATVDTLVDDVAHVADVAGVECVALGSDFEGASVPSDIGGVAGLPIVVDALHERFSASEARAIAAGNWRRVLGEVWG